MLSQHQNAVSPFRFVSAKSGNLKGPTILAGSLKIALTKLDSTVALDFTDQECLGPDLIDFRLLAT